MMHKWLIWRVMAMEYAMLAAIWALDENKKDSAVAHLEHGLRWRNK